MPDRVTRRTALILIAAAFCLALAVQAFAGGSSTPQRVVQAKDAALAEQPGPAADLALKATPRIPALRNPIKPKPKRKPKPKPKKRPKAVAAPVPRAMAPAATPTPTPLATPQYVPTPAPTPRYIPPRRTPAPTATPPPEPSGDFDTTGER